MEFDRLFQTYTGEPVDSQICSGEYARSVDAALVKRLRNAYARSLISPDQEADVQEHLDWLKALRELKQAIYEKGREGYQRRGEPGVRGS